jgi:hypothetical protein
MSELPNLDTIDAIGRNEPDQAEADPFAPFIGMTLEELQAMDMDDAPARPKPADVGTRARLLADAVPGVVTADRLRGNGATIPRASVVPCKIEADTGQQGPTPPRRGLGSYSACHTPSARGTIVQMQTESL